MTWQEIRDKYPDRWVVVEALGAFTQDGQRVIPNLQPIAVFGEDWREAWNAYEALHRADKWREYYPLHPDRQELNIGVLNNIGPIFFETNA
jgi:hypothetical protein